MLEKFGNPENLSIKDLIAKYRYTQNVPYWQTPEALEWMESKRKDNELQEQLPLIEESDKMVQKIDEIIPIVGYITIRPRSVLSGTRNWLNKHSFPKVDILARPSDIHSSEGNQWKAEVLLFLYPQVLGIIDDSPSVVEKLSKEYKGTVYLYDSNEATRGDIHVIPCKTWADVHCNVELLHGNKK